VIKKYINNVNIESTNDKQKFDPNNTLYKSRILEKEAMKSTKHGGGFKGGDASLNAKTRSSF